MSFGTLIQRHPMRHAAAAIFDAERAMDAIQRQFASYPTPRFVDPRPFVPRIDAVETEKQYVITAELPGVEAATLEVCIEDAVLAIKGERRGRSEIESRQTEGDTESRETFERRIRFNGEIVEEAVQASYKDGLLTVTVPKPEEPIPEVRTIPVQIA